MSTYYLPFDDVASGAVADTFLTICGILVADTVGHRCRLLGLDIGPADDTPGDKNFVVAVKRIEDVSIGTAGTAGDTVSAANMPKLDTDSVNCLMTGPRNYSVEPTTYATEALWLSGLNDRGIIQKVWDRDEAPVFLPDMFCGILIAPRSAAAIRVSGSLTFETY